MYKLFATKNKFAIIAIILFISFLLFIIAVSVGYINLSFGQLINLLTGQLSQGLNFAIVTFRLPRVIMAALLGVGLSVSGCILQCVTRNKLAEPGLLGINAGAGFMVACYISIFSVSLGNASLMLPLLAFAGALVTIIIIYLLSYQSNGGISPSRFLLTGIAVSSAINALTIMLLLRVKQHEYGFIANWLSGNIWGATWENIVFVMPCIIILFLCVCYKARALNVLSLSEQSSIGLGINLQREHISLILLSVGLSSVCVSVGGGISFIGLICPHLARKIVGSQHQWLVPTSALLGIVLMLLSDIISRTIIAPDEIAIGIIAVLIGVPYFLYLFIDKKG